MLFVCVYLTYFIGWYIYMFTYFIIIFLCLFLIENKLWQNNNPKPNLLLNLETGHGPRPTGLLTWACEHLLMSPTLRQTGSVNRDHWRSEPTLQLSISVLTRMNPAVNTGGRSGSDLRPAAAQSDAAAEQRRKESELSKNLRNRITDRVGVSAWFSLRHRVMQMQILWHTHTQ